MTLRDQIVDGYGNERRFVLDISDPSFEDLEKEVGQFFAGWEVNL